MTYAKCNIKGCRKKGKHKMTHPFFNEDGDFYRLFCDIHAVEVRRLGWKMIEN